jgi:hypothetical protein
MTPPPDIWCCRAVELAVRVLPAEHRQRYGLEFIAELYGMPRREQIRHSVQVLSHAWALRAALDACPHLPPVGRECGSVQRRRRHCV